MKHFIKENGAIHGYEDNQLHLVTEDMRELDAIEFKARITQQPSQFHVWDEGNLKWIDPRTDEELLMYQTYLLPALSAKDFRHMLDREGLRIQVETMLEAISDPNTKAALKTEYEYAQFFERTHPAVVYMMSVLGLTVEEVNTAWKVPTTFDFVLPTSG